MITDRVMAPRSGELFLGVVQGALLYPLLTLPPKPELIAKQAYTAGALFVVVEAIVVEEMSLTIRP